ncbi:hypothetical protein LG047_12440 [Methylocystis sp. WRRC1]|nr:MULTISPECIES: hypothetical protein [unclassified Methylocystis]MCC3246118.1 hypothetical protein [Methylocystis sp. WRRC1]
MSALFEHLAGVGPAELACALAVASAAGVACGVVMLTVVWVFLVREG